MPFVTVTGGISLRYDEVGEGDPIVWIPGTGQRGPVWTKYQLPAFTDRYRCITVDLRESAEGSPATYTVATMAKDVEGIARALQLERAHFVGLSLGSAIIQELALAAPELVRSAVLLGTWSSTPREHHLRRHFEARILCAERAPVEVYRAFSFWAWGPTFVDEEPEAMAELERFLGEVSAGVTMQTYIDHFRADLAHDTLDRLHEIRCPTLVLYGDEDRITLPRYNERVAAAVPGAESKEIRRGGHMVWAERPDEVNAAIRDFLERVARLDQDVACETDTFTVAG